MGRSAVQFRGVRLLSAGHSGSAGNTKDVAVPDLFVAALSEAASPPLKRRKDISLRHRQGSAVRYCVMARALDRKIIDHL